MIRLLLTKFKNILLLLLIGAMVVSTTSFSHAGEVNYTNTKQAITIQQKRDCEVVIRAGEYQGKAGKRIYVNSCTVNLPDDIPIRNDRDGKGFYVSEWDINVKEAKALVNKLQAQGVNAKLQIAYDKSEDLNAAGRIANKSNPYLYISVHHNSYKEDSSGYFTMYNENDAVGRAMAVRLSNAIRNNQVPQMGNRPNGGYIGEMNVINKTTIPVLLELGFFSNLDELETICSDSYVDDITTKLSNEIVNIIKESR